MDDTAFANAKALREAGRCAEAIATLEQILTDQPGNLDARRWLADSLLAQGNSVIRDQPAESERCYRRAIYTWPGFFEAISNLGEALVEQLHLPEALTMFRTALALRPTDANTGFSYAIALLLSGDFAEGWHHFEARRAMAAWHYDRRHEHPQWQEGMPVHGRHLLLMSEQGIGDILQFARYAPLLAASGVDVSLEVPPTLLPLFQHMPGVRAVVTPDQPAPDCDLACPLMSLPLLSGTNIESIPPSLPPLRVPHERLAVWRDRLGPRTEYRIGLVCSGDPRNPKDAARTLPFAALAPLFSVPGCRFVLLQPALRDSDRAAAAAAPRLLQPGGLLRDFADTAAVVSQLDLVIAADTGVAHLAATLGCPVWLLLPHRPDWRWLLGRRDSPWYPTMTLYRQPVRAAWDDVVAAVRTDLLAFCARAPRRAPATEPSSAEAWLEHGNAALERGDACQAEACYRRATALRPDYGAAWNNLGNALLMNKQAEAAVAACREAVRCAPGSPEVHLGLGNALMQCERWEEAESAYRSAVALQPDYVDAWNNLGNALLARNRAGEAIAAYRAALAHQPHKALLYLGLGNACLRNGDPEEGEACYRQALVLQPDFAGAMGNLGNALVLQHRLAEANSAYRRALELDPGNPGIRYDYAQGLLLAGDFAEGWRQHEARRALPHTQPHFGRHAGLPQWHEGMRVEGRHVLLTAEQGIGDTLQFARYASLLARRGVPVTLEVLSAVRPVFDRLPGVHAVTTAEAPAHTCDLACPLMSLPFMFGTDMDTIPSEPAALHVPAEQTLQWVRWLGSSPGFRVGIVCSGNPNYLRYAERSVPLAALAPVFAIPGCRFVLLQPELRDIDRAAADEGLPLLMPGVDLRDFGDTAAIVSQLDLVIASDTGVAHLAASLGCPVWLLLHYTPDWRWLLGRRDSPWYPTMTLYRQQARGDWAGVVETVYQDLIRLLGG